MLLFLLDNISDQIILRWGVLKGAEVIGTILKSNWDLREYMQVPLII